MSILKRKERYKAQDLQTAQQYVGVLDELVICREEKGFRVHDGITPGGMLISIKDFLDEQEILSLIDNNNNSINLEDINFKLNNGEYGWSNLSSNIYTDDDSGSPRLKDFKSNVKGWRFKKNDIQQCWVDFRMNHDYALNTKVFPRLHWGSNENKSGTVRWGIEYTVAKGHGQGSDSQFPISSIIYLEQNLSATDIDKHLITEVTEAQAILSTNLEPDSLILMRIFRDATHINDTYPDYCFLFRVDLHYQVGQLVTRNKAPDFFL